jgi:hypothetical protein
MALAQKMFKCPDGKGGVTFQQAACAETPEEADKRAKEREAREAEAARKKAEEARKKEEAIQKGKERDAAYQQQMKERAEAQKAAADLERKILEGTGKEGGAKPVAAAAAAGGAAPATDDDGGLPPHVAQTYPGPWKTGGNTIIASALGKKQVVGCDKYRYRQRPNGEFMVNCIPGKNHYFVWPQSEAVSGPVKF